MEDKETKDVGSDSTFNNTFEWENAMLERQNSVTNTSTPPATLHKKSKSTGGLLKQVRGATLNMNKKSKSKEAIVGDPVLCKYV
jgi:hypothetical protein